MSIEEIINEHNIIQAQYVGGCLLSDKDFIIEWVDDNKIYFVDDEYLFNEDSVKNLLIATSNYKKNIQTKKIRNNFNKFSKSDKKGKKVVQELIDRNKPKLSQVYEDLKYNATTSKNRQLLKIIEEFIEDPKLFFPIIQTKETHANNKELKDFLNSLNLTKIAIDEYLKHFNPATA